MKKLWIFSAVTITMQIVFLGCLGPDHQTKNPIDYFSGEWEASVGEGKIRHIFLSENKLRVQRTYRTLGKDSLFSDLLFNYRVLAESSMVEQKLDSVINHPFQLVPGQSSYFYYKPMGDTLLVGLTEPFMLEWISEGTNPNNELFRTWRLVQSGLLTTTVGSDSTGNYGGKKVDFRISNDLFIFQDPTEVIGGNAFYYEVKGNSMRTWKAKYDCSDKNCAVEEQYYFHMMK